MIRVRCPLSIPHIFPRPAWARWVTRAVAVSVREAVVVIEDGVLVCRHLDSRTTRDSGGSGLSQVQVHPARCGLNRWSCVTQESVALTKALH